jgi:Spy/CpxP family protein refolding chaperone
MTCLLVLLSASLLLAQTQTSPPTSAPPAGTGQTRPTQRRGRRQPCWQQVGISQSAAQERRQIEENTRSQMESVCSDSSLSAQQKEQKIHQLREESRRQAEALINPQQEQELRSCRQQRGEGRGGHGGHGGGMHSGGGPCGELPTGTRGAKPLQQSGSASEQD